jgi:Ca2+-binding RTX toxin-like protein
MADYASIIGGNGEPLAFDDIPNGVDAFYQIDSALPILDLSDRTGASIVDGASNPSDLNVLLGTGNNIVHTGKGDDVIIGANDVSNAEPVIDWDTLADRVNAYHDSTGQWGLLDDWLSSTPPDGGATDYLRTGNDLIDAGNGDNLVTGGAGNDRIIAGTGDDTLSGGAGGDIIRGGSGRDYIDGGDGNDALMGGKGNDDLRGGSGNDYLSGGQGKDHLSGGDGDDFLIGGVGQDQFYFEDDFGRDQIADLGKGDQIMFTANLNGSGIMQPSDIAQFVTGGSGETKITIGTSSITIHGIDPETFLNGLEHWVKIV